MFVVIESHVGLAHLFVDEHVIERCHAPLFNRGENVHGI